MADGHGIETEDDLMVPTCLFSYLEHPGSCLFLNDTKWCANGSLQPLSSAALPTQTAPFLRLDRVTFLFSLYSLST